MATKSTQSPSFVVVLIFIAIASCNCKNANGATYHDLLITNDIPVRLYFPSTDTNEKFPLVVYYHGGGFELGSTKDIFYNPFLQELVDHSNVIAFSVDYRLSDLFVDVSTSYADSWTALQYVASHFNGSGPDPTLNTRVDFGKIFLSGDSAGGNIAHNMAMKIASEKIKGLRIEGIALLCPYFWGSKPIGYESYDPIERYVLVGGFWAGSARSLNLDDTRINPLVDPKLATLGTSKVLVIAADLDPLFYRGKYYAAKLSTNLYKGKVYLNTYHGIHDFFIFTPYTPEYFNVLDRVAWFFNNA